MTRFRSGDKIVITNGTLTGSIAFIANEYVLPDEQGGTKYSLQPEGGYSSSIPNPFKDMRFPPEDLTLMTPRPEPKVDFDFSKYIDEERMREIAERLYEKQLAEWFESIMRNRVGLNGNTIDQILHALAERYVDKLAPTFEEDFFRKCKEEINREIDPDNGNYYPFRQGLNQKLQNTAGRWIDENLETIQKELKPAIEEAIEHLTTEGLANAIGYKLNGKIKELLLEVLKEQQEKEETP